MTTSPVSRNVPANPTSGLYLLSWKERTDWVLEKKRKPATEPWWATPQVLVGSGFVAFCVAQFLSGPSVLGQILFTVGVMCAAYTINKLITYHSPSIVSLYPAHLRQRRGQSFVRIEYKSVSYFTWKNTVDGIILEMHGTDGWAIQFSVRNEQIRERADKILKEAGLTCR